MKVVFATKARADLRHILHHLIAENPRAARAVVDNLQAKALGIADFPDRFGVLTVHGGVQLRRRVVGRYLILFKVDKDQIVVVNVFHGSRDIARILAGSED